MHTATAPAAIYSYAEEGAVIRIAAELPRHLMAEASWTQEFNTEQCCRRR